MTKCDEIFYSLEYIKFCDCIETGLVLTVKYADPIEIKYHEITEFELYNFIEKARKKEDCILSLPVHQYQHDFSCTFEIYNGILSVPAYEGKDHHIDTFESSIEIQLPFLEILCKAIIECKNTGTISYIDFLD